jgi:DNA helicase INO80
LLDKIVGLEEGDSVASLMNLVMQFRKVCNHPELFERASVESPFQMYEPVEASLQIWPGRVGEIENWVKPVNRALQYEVPKLLHDEGLVPLTPELTKKSIVERLFDIFSPENIHADELVPDETFGFRSLTGLTYGDVSRVSRADFSTMVMFDLERRREEESKFSMKNLEFSPNLRALTNVSKTVSDVRIFLV